MSGFYIGTSKMQDGRFMNKEKKLIQERTWPKHFDEKVDLKGVGKLNIVYKSRLLSQIDVDLILKKRGEQRLIWSLNVN